LTGDGPAPKTVVIGLDGVGWSLIERLVGQGVMPRLGALIDVSTAGPMLSTLPEISPVAWTTFFTGRPPGEHGVYGFTDFEPEAYRIRYNSSLDVRVPFLWDWMGLRGERSVVLNVPMTYPARPLDGVMVSGFIALDYDRAAYPAWVADYLRRTGYRLEADFERVHHDRPAFQADLDAALAGRLALIERFWPDPWDLFALVVTDTDRLQHFFLDEFLRRGPVEGYFLDFMARVDALVGRVMDLIDRSGQPIRLFMLSDHGFAPVEREFHLNRWLADRGFQTGPGPEALALALDPTRIYLNQPTRFPGGRVGRNEAWTLAAEITAGLLMEPAVAGVSRGDEIYSGPRAHLGPDLVVHPRPGFEFKAKFTPGPLYTDSPLQGAHTREDAFFLIHGAGNRTEPAEIQSIEDFGACLFSSRGI